MQFPQRVAARRSDEQQHRPSGPPFPARADPEYTAYTFGECGADTAVVHHPHRCIFARKPSSVRKLMLDVDIDSHYRSSYGSRRCVL
jgi:hypothetical protein